MPHAHPSGFPPRAFDLGEKRTPTNAVSLSTEAWRGTGPRPTVKGAVLRLRNRPVTVARGPVPRERSTYAKTTRRPRPFPVPIEARRGTGPRPTVSGDGLAYRSAGACPPRAPDLRENRTPTNAVFPTEARRGTGPRPTVNGDGLAYRSAGACPPRLFDPRENRTPTNAVFLSIEAWRGTGPRPTVNSTLFLTVARGTGPRATGQDEKNAGDKPPRDKEEQRDTTPAA